jgi:hypothetical protein
MRWVRLLPVCCFVALALACGGVGGGGDGEIFGFVYEKRLVGDFGLVACDTKDQMSVVEFVPTGAVNWVPETVFAVGWDPAHIIAKRHPREDFHVDRSRTEYYIVVLRTRRVYGPFDPFEFALHRDLLGVAEGLDFTLTFSELE